MSEPTDSPPDFETRLQREVDRVLMDPAFQRSPVQSRLLGYLCEQTVGRNRNISQIEIAVDGLGRPETADQLTESYPRVQISRLRRNLALYYARCAPGEGLAVYIRHGDYQLRLAPPDSAYGENRRRAAPQPPANDAAAPDGRAAGEPPAQPPTRIRKLVLAAVTLLVVAGLFSLAYAVRERADAAGAPTLTVQIGAAATGEDDPLLVLAARHADDVANSSYVVRSLRPEENAGARGYTVRLQRSESISALPVLEVALYGPDNRRLLHDSIPVGDDRSALLVRLNGALVQMVSPVGVIARRELAAASDEPRNDYECVLRTEADRLQGFSTAPAQTCLERFPDSPYRAYWYSRIALIGYRESVLSGGTVRASGEPWRNLQLALEADAGNPFANYLAAKVHIARGDCETARPYTERALANSPFYGALTAASAAEAALCSDTLNDHFECERRIAALMEGVPNPNPLLHVYLVFSAAAVDRPDLARRLLASAPEETSEGVSAQASAVLRAALADPAAFAEHRDRLELVVDGFFWGPASRAKLMTKLEAVATSAA